MKFAALFLACTLHAAELRIQVFTLFSITELEVEAPSLRLGGQMLPSPTIVAARGDKVCAGQVCGQSLRSHGGKTRLEWKGSIARSFSGEVEVLARGGHLIAVIRMDVEEAVAAVLAGEMPAAPPGEAHAAQSVAVRSYYAAHRLRHRDADFCDTTHCQYLTAGTAASREVALRTRGVILRYQGRPVPAMYFRSCGGRTMRAEEIGLSSASFPFASVDCAACRRDPFPWTSEIPEQMWTADRTEAARLALTRRLGWDRIPSNDYTVERKNGRVLLRGRGHGHGVGMCQRGATAMAAAGENFQAILRHYFPAASIGE